jgi:hypothetical protein
VRRKVLRAKNGRALSALKVSRLAKPGLYPDGAGLYLQVTGSDAKSWCYRFIMRHCTRDMGLGSLAVVSLMDARIAAGEARKLCHAGVDPIEHRKVTRAAAFLAAAKGVTFKACAVEFMKAQGPGWRNPKHKQQWKNTLATYAYPRLGELAAGAVDVGLVLDVFQPIWTTKTETAKRLRGRIEAILDYAAAHGYRVGETLPDGAAISTSCWRRRRRFESTFIIRRWPTMICLHSCGGSRQRKGRLLELSNFLSSRSAARAT